MKLAFAIGVIVASGLLSQPVSSADTTVHPEQWPAVQWPLPQDAKIASRVQALMDRMSVEEKVGQMVQADLNSVTPDDVRRYHLGSVLAGGNSKPGGLPKAGVAQWQAAADAFWRASTDKSAGGQGIPVLFGIDAVHGHNNAVGATLFPQNSALGAMRDPALMEKIGAATAAEVRATGISWTFAPTLAVVRDDRWGRSYEGYSEDPSIVAAYSKAMVEGLQGKVGTPAFLDTMHAVATAKHFLGDGGTTNGKDQGSADISEADLRTIHGAGYPPAVAAGVQTVMASFSAWNGVKMHGNKALLTDVLKGRMDFGGFVVGDWNGHGQVPGCSNDDCAAAINAGVDMLMAPDSWRGLVENTVREVKAGQITTQRLDDAVRRILTVKVRSGLLDAGLPSAQPAARQASSIVGSPAHRDLARQAVRESLVLLKNNGGLLPLNPRSRILVTGDAADSISRQSGGWTLNWQGVGLTNADFPGAQSIWAGIKAQVDKAGGTAVLSTDGTFSEKPDVAVVVFGEEPYAEFQGDIPNLAYRPGDDHDLELLRALHARHIPVVAVFLSGRPLWVNRELNASDAFVAAWLPGSEGEGVADVLLRDAHGQIAHDFRGRLAYSWPRTATQTPLNLGQAGYDPLFAFGYGLTYATAHDLGVLSENSGVKGQLVQPGLFFDRGKAVAGMQDYLVGANGKRVPARVAPTHSDDGAVSIASVDFKAQEDARRLRWTQAHARFVLESGKALDLEREVNGDVMLALWVRAKPSSSSLRIGMNCGLGCEGMVNLAPTLASVPPDTWARIGIPLKCFRVAGTNMAKVMQPVVLEGGDSADIAVSRVWLGMDVDKVVDCPTH
ncbi:glycoside hydrolase family 3 protein [Pinirhizobacter sp.]|uniref:glycoside hydrolase family 3 protein n=1 Tax=Pinirhizobacter sp. TaxID=2950432 RepID=UPI002F3E29DF